MGQQFVVTISGNAILAMAALCIVPIILFAGFHQVVKRSNSIFPPEED